MISAWATWTSQGVCLNGRPLGPAKGPLGAWAEAPPLSKIHPRARRPHRTARQLVQLASCTLAGSRVEGLGLLLGTTSGCALPDREFQAELDTKGWPLGGPSLFVYTLPTAAAGEMSIALDAKGPLLTVNAGAASGLAGLVRASEWVRSGRCPAALACSAELGVADEHIAMFLLTRGAGRALVGSTGFGGELDAGAGLHGPLELAAALSAPGPATVRSADPLGYWASVTLEGRP